MAKPQQVLREMLARYGADRAIRQLALIRGEPWVADEAVAQRLRFLQGEQSLEALEEARSRGELDGPSGGALLQQLAWARVDVQFADGQLDWERALTQKTGKPPRVAAEQLGHVLAIRDAGARAKRLQSCLATMDEQAMHFLSMQAGFPGRLRAEGGQLADAGLSERRQVLLDETAAPVAEWLHYLARPHLGRGSLRLDAALCALRGAHLDGLFKLAGRFRRVAAPLRALGFERVMGQRMRTDVDGLRLLPRPTVEWLSADGIYVVGHGRFGGCLAELAAMHGAASGLSLALTSSALPWELSAPLPDHPCHALGGLFAQLLVDRVFLRRMYGLSGKDLEEVRRNTALGYLVSLRLGAVFTKLSGANRGELVEQAIAGLREALQLDCDAWALPLLCDEYTAAYSRFSGQLAGLRLHVAMRERFDEDYFVNPRFGDVLMAASARGNELTVPMFLEEVAADASWERQRLGEIV